MLYLIFEKLSPFVPIFIICPLLSIMVALLCHWFRIKVMFGVCIALLLTLLFIANKISTLKANLDAWVLYGVIYALITYGVFKAVKLKTLPKKELQNSEHFAAPFRPGQ